MSHNFKTKTANMKKLHTIAKLLILAGMFLGLKTQAQNDPSLVWAKALNNSSGSSSTCAFTRLDASGNVYAVGNFSGTVDFDLGVGVANFTSAGGTDAFIAKYDANGNYIRTIVLGSTGSDQANGIAIDNNGNIFVCGNFNNTVDFDPGVGVSNRTSPGGSDIFIAKYNADGNYLWSNSIGAPNTDQGLALAIDESNNVIVTGSVIGGNVGNTIFDNTVFFSSLDNNTRSLTVPISIGAHILLAKYDDNGNYIWAKAMGSVGSLNRGICVRTDNNGNIILGGTFCSSSTAPLDFDPGVGTANKYAAGSSVTIGDAFVAKYNAFGDFISVFTFGGTGNDQVNDLGLDANGNLFVTGAFNSTVDFDPGTNTVNRTSAGSNDIYLAKYNNSGNFLWANTMGSSVGEAGAALFVESGGDVVFTARYNYTIDFDPSAITANLTSAGVNDIVLAKYDASGNYISAVSMGGSSTEQVLSLTSNGTGKYFISGQFVSTDADFDPGVGTTILSAVGTNNGFLAAYNYNTSSCQPTSSTETISSCGSYTWHGNTYTASNNTATWTGVNAGGCDSVVTLNLTIKAATSSTTTITTDCNVSSYLWNGVDYTASGTYTWTGVNAEGCDSIATLQLTSRSANSSSSSITATDSYSWNNQTYTTSGVYTYASLNAAGCDSVATLNLTINISVPCDTTYSTTEFTTCNSYSWYGQNYTTSGNYTHVIPNAAGCDSVETLQLTIVQSSSSDTSATACDHFIWYGELYSASGDYIRHVANAQGCDSAITLHVTINNPSAADVTHAACGSYDFLGTNYTSSGNFTHIIQNANGCDSVITLHLTINSGSNNLTVRSTCGSTTWNGQTYTASGVYVYNYTNTTGCASADTLRLTVQPVVNTAETHAACDVYTWNGNSYDSSGVYLNEHADANGCIATDTLYLTIILNLISGTT